MKKFGKFVFGTITIASVAAGAYYLYKNFIKNDSNDDFDDFEDDFEDFDKDFGDDTDKDSREYVSINITSEENDDAVETEEDAQQDASTEE